MKNSKNILVAALAGIALSLFAGSVQAQVKGAESLIQHNDNSSSTITAPSSSTAMACPKCRDISTVTADTASQGLGARTLVAHAAATKTVVSHSCEGCGSTPATAGLGKHAENVTTHQCTVPGAENMACCSTAKNSVK
jgi:hypothetical protein